jgi:hypothetical protein
MENNSILILGILGDILGFKNGRIKKNRFKITKKKYGESYIPEGKNLAVTDFYSFFLDGGINVNINTLKYSINTLLLMATIKGIINNKTNMIYENLNPNINSINNDDNNNNMIIEIDVSDDGNTFIDSQNNTNTVYMEYNVNNSSSITNIKNLYL